MVQALVLIPALIAIAMFNGLSAAKVVVRLYLPCLLLVPLYLQFKLGGLSLDVTSLVALFLATVGIYASFSTLRFTLLDAFVIANGLSAFYTDVHRHDLKVGAYSFCTTVLNTVCPYIIGRTLIEQAGMRKRFAKTLVICLAAIAFLSVFEYRMEKNMFQDMAEALMHAPSGWIRQSRWGFGRIAGPYGHAIIAGMVFTTGLFVQLWLMATKSWDTFKFLTFLRSRRKPLYLTLAIVLGLFMTQSRGPWIGCGFGLIVSSAGFARNRRRAVIIAISLLTIAFVFTSITLNKYTDVETAKVTDQDQQNASYRRDLLKTYQPMIEQGGLWGWGTPGDLGNGTAGYSKYQTSIDNEYLRLAVAQGYVGVMLFVAMILLTILHLVKLCVSLSNRDDVLFVYCLLGSVLAMAFTLTTVYLGNPMLQIVYLFLGWSMSVRPTLSAVETRTALQTGRYAFQRVFA